MSKVRIKIPAECPCGGVIRINLNIASTFVDYFGVFNRFRRKVGIVIDYMLGYNIIIEWM